jgi:hypothetical protein
MPNPTRLMLCGLVLSLLTASANAQFWQIQNLTFDDGGTGTGSITWDGTYESLNIMTVFGFVNPPTVYTFVCSTKDPARAPCTGVIPANDEGATFVTGMFADYTGKPALVVFYPEFSKPGGQPGDPGSLNPLCPTTLLLRGTEGFCGDAGCTFLLPPGPSEHPRSITTGSIASSMTVAYFPLCFG